MCLPILRKTPTSIPTAALPTAKPATHPDSVGAALLETLLTTTFVSLVTLLDAPCVRSQITVPTVQQDTLS